MADRQTITKGGESSAVRRSAVRLKKDMVNFKSWVAFLQVYLTDGTQQDPLRFNGAQVEEKHLRSIHRWLKEGSTPTIWSIDDFLCTYAMNSTDFEIFCFTEGRPMWEGDPPDWWDE